MKHRKIHPTLEDHEMGQPGGTRFGDVSAWARGRTMPVFSPLFAPALKVRTQYTGKVVAPIAANVPQPIEGIVAPLFTPEVKRDVCAVVDANLAAADFVNRALGLLK